MTSQSARQSHNSQRLQESAPPELPQRPETSVNPQFSDLLAREGEVIVPAKASPITEPEVSRLLRLARTFEYRDWNSSPAATFCFRYHTAYLIHPEKNVIDTKEAREFRTKMMSPEQLTWMNATIGMSGLEILRLQVNWYQGRDYLGAHDHEGQGKVSAVLNLQELQSPNGGGSIATHFIEDWSSGRPYQKVTPLNSGDWAFTLASERHGVQRNPFYGKDFDRDRFSVVYFLG